VEDIDIMSVLEECIQLLQPLEEQDGVKVNLHDPGGRPVVKGDRSKIKQVVLNLLTNAIKYNVSQGEVDIDISIEPQGLVLQIKDTGVGIPAESIPHLFERFYRVPGTEQKTSGIGLGLSITKRIVEDHGGHIEVKSQIGVGTTITVHLSDKTLLL
jgi:two-component system phosphate regulon sensor histidine kinase PhoR